MSVRPIIDAGPGLNFISINKERLLIATGPMLCCHDVVTGDIAGCATAIWMRRQLAMGWMASRVAPS